MIATHPSDTNLVDQVDNNDNENNDDNADTNNQQAQDSGQTNIETHNQNQMTVLEVQVLHAGASQY